MNARTILFVGPLSQPVHGQSVATNGTAALLEQSGYRLIRVDTAEGAGGLLRRVRRKATGFLHALAAIRRTDAPLVYLSVGANRGMALTALLARAARRRGRSLVLHHHAFSYIGRHQPRAASLVEAAGPSALHVVNCPAMANALTTRYPAAARVLPFSNIGFVAEPPRSPTRTAGGVVFGHLSNLTEEKGIGRAIDALRAVRAKGIDARLIVGGPTGDDYAANAIVAAQREFGDAFEYRGPVYDAAKADFLGSIDLFLFPSRYANETQGIVLLEALSAGVPVVAFGQCCIPDDLAGGGGIAVDPTDDYGAAVEEMVDRLLADGTGVASAARARFDSLLDQYRSERTALLEAIARMVA